MKPDVGAFSDELCRSCSTFLLRDEQIHVVGHNLDSPFGVPGCLFVNARGVHKVGVSAIELITGQKPASPGIEWTSRYGSVTLNTFARDLPDCGVNEAGLCVHEMSLPETQYPVDDDRARMYVTQWIQYLLDSFGTVGEAVASLPSIVLEGMSWHFLVADKSGDYAGIEFLGGEAVVLTGESMPIPLMCNAPYAQEMENLENYEGYGGAGAIDVGDKSVERFVRGAYLLDHAPRPASVEFAAGLLDHLTWEETRWSSLIDLNRRRVTFSTSQNQKRKHLDLDALDFEAEVRMLDIDADVEGDVLELLEPYSSQRHKEFVQAAIESLDEPVGFTQIMASAGGTLQDLIDRTAAVAESAA